MLDYCYFNPHPKKLNVPDCVKRAIVVVTGADYHELTLDMNRKKKDKSRPFNDNTNYKNYIINYLGGVKIKMSVPKGTSRWDVNSIDNVMKQYPNVKYILRVAKHLIGVKNNTIYDTFDDREYNKSIYEMWLFGASEEECNEIQEKVTKGNYRVL